MKRIFSTVLALMLILSSFSFTAMTAFAADGEIAIQAATLNNVLASDGIKAAAKATLLQGDNAPDGITAVKVNPDPCEDRDPKYNVECKVTLECYPTGLGITPASYKYARITYKYVPAEDDTNEYSPYIEFMTTATGFKSYKSSEKLVANKWSVLDIEVSGTNYSADEVIKQLRVNAFGEALGTLDYEGGSYDPTKVTVANPDSTLYIANLAFFNEKPGVPTVTGIEFANATASVTRGTSATLPKVIVSGVYSPITSYDLVLAGHTSANTKLSADATTIFIGEDEEADTITLTATSVADNTKSAVLTITVTDPAPRSKFDADNVVMSFGVVSDVHLSGSWNQPRSKAKWSHVIDVFQNLGADAILMNGDLTDAINSPGNVNGGGLHTDKNGNGTKAEQNFREVSYVAQAMWGEADGGYGNGTNDTTKMFYSLGNHDEGGQGYSGGSSSRSFKEVYSADYFAAVICGWQYNPNSEAALAAPDGMEDSYRSYIADLLDYNTNAATTVTAASFQAAHGVTLASADAKFDKFFGFDSEYSLKDEHGLRYGNRHMTIDPDGEKDADLSDDIHFIAMELSQSADSIAWAEEIIKKSITENPNKPIFVITHYKTAGTTLIGSQYQNITRLGDLLSNYPQAFVWGGHNHTFLHSDRAIDTSNGYVATDSAVTAYASMYNLTNGNYFGENSGTENWAYNASTKENHAYGNGAFVELDKDFNVRINRVDLYRSYSADYAENPALFSTDEFKNFASKASCEPTDKAVFIRQPWDLTDIGPEGTHLQDYTKGRFEMSDVPEFESADSLSVESGKIGLIPVKFTMDATDPDGMVYMYLLEISAKGEDKVLQRYYFTNKFYDYPDANIPEITIDHTFAGLSPATTYVVSLTPVDDLMNKGVALTAEATTLDGDTKITLEDGKIAVLVDTTGENTTYKWTDGKTYFVYGSMAEAVAAQSDIIYVIAGDMKLYFKESDGSYTNEFKGMKAGAKVIGLDREKAIIRYNASYSLHQDLWFENVQISREGTSDCGITLQGKSLTLVDVKGLTKDLNIFNTGWGGSDPSGTLVIKGDTGHVEAIFPGPNYGANAGSKGDVNITLEGGTYGNVGNAKNQPGNKIDGNVYITVTGGTYNAIKASQTSANHKVTKNAVLRLLGGEFTTVGLAGTTNVDGKDITIFTNAVLENITTLNKATNGIYITIPNDVTDAVGAATLDANGYITGFAVKQIDGKKSFVNGEAATSFTVENGKEYEITYKTPNAIEFDLNGGEGDVPASITGNAGDDVTSQMPDGAGISKENHNFLGWSTDKNATAPDTSFAITADGTVVYAVWQAKEKIKVTLDLVGGTCEVTEVEGFADETLTLPTAAKDGAVFVGWAESEDAEERFIEYTLSEAKTLYAVFVDYHDQVIYIDPKAEVSGDGKSIYSPIKAFDAAAIALSKDVATTYVFMNSTCIDAFQDSAGKTATFTCFDPILGTKYDSYVYYQGSNMGSPRLSRNFVLDIPFAHARTDVDYICLNTRGNYTHFGENYFKPADGSTIPGTNIICKTGIDQIRGGGDGVNPESTDLKFENLDNVNATIRAGSQQGNVVGNTSVMVYNGSKDAEIGLGNDSNKSNTIGGNAVLKIFNYYEKATITVTANIDSIGGAVYYILTDDAADNVTIEDKASAKAAKGAYLIKSYAYGKGDVTVSGDDLYIHSYTGELYINGTKQEISADNTYDLGEAGTYIITYDNLARNTVSYDLNGVDGTAPESYTAKENDAVDLPTLDIELEGMTFIGWNTDKDAEAALESLTMGKEAVTLYAIFKKAEYDVTFDAGIGKAAGELASVKKIHGEDLTLPTDYILYGTGLEFAGWSENPDATAEEVVTTYTANEATTFFAIYNEVGTANVTPDEAADGTYYVITESDAAVEAPEFDIPGTATEVSKVDITLMDAATGTEVQPTAPVTFTIHCDEGALNGKAVYVYHVCDNPEFVDATVNGDDVTFTVDHLSTFVIYTVEVDAKYVLKGQYNNVTGLYTVSLYYNGKKANSGSFGFAYDNTVYALDAFTYAEGIDAVVETAHDEANAVVTGTWYPTTGAYVGGNDEDVLIGTFTFACDIADYDMTKAAERFYEFKADAAIDEVFDGTYYLYAPNSASDLEVTFAPIVTMDVVDLEPVTVTYKVNGSLVTVREDGKSPVSYAKAIVTTENGTKVAEFAIENAETATGTVAFSFETAPGTYNLTVVKNGYLEETISFNVTDGDLDIGEITPVPGDIRGNEADAQGDGKIDLADFVRVLRGFEYTELASHVDINEDGSVNVTDLGYVKSNYGETK